MHMLDNRRNVIMRKFRVLLGKTTLYRIDMRPLFLRHARHHRKKNWIIARDNWILARSTLSSHMPHLATTASAETTWSRPLFEG
jgi:hypothetical protein